MVANLAGVLMVCTGLAQGLNVGAPAPELIGVTDTAGQPVLMAQLRGRAVLLDFWASWCEPCRDATPILMSLYRKYRADGLEIVGISIDEDCAAAAQYVQGEGLPWRQVCDGLGFGSPPAAAFGVTMLPFLVLVNRDGHVAAVDPPPAILEREVPALLGVPRRAYAPGAALSWEPHYPRPGETFTLRYRPEISEHQRAQRLFARWGINHWRPVQSDLWPPQSRAGRDGLPDTPWVRDATGWLLVLQVPANAAQLDLLIHTGKEAEPQWSANLDTTLGDDYRWRLDVAEHLVASASWSGLLRLLGPLADPETVPGPLRIVATAHLVEANERLGREEEARRLVDGVRAGDVFDAAWMDQFAWTVATSDDASPGHLHVAEAVAESFVRHNPSPSQRDTYAWLLYRAGKLEQAEEVLQALLKDWKPPQADYLLRYAAVLGARKKPQEALRAYDRASSLRHTPGSELFADEAVAAMGPEAMADARGYPKLLGEAAGRMAAEGQYALWRLLDQKIQLALRTRKVQRSKAPVLLGRVLVPEGQDPREVLAQMEILDEGWYVTPLANGDRTVGLSMWGCEPVILEPTAARIEGPFALAPVQRLLPVAPARQARLRGCLTLAPDEVAERGDLQLMLAMWPLNVAGDEVELRTVWPAPQMPKFDKNGCFETAGLAPGRYQLVVRKEGYVSTAWTVVLGPGEIRDMGMLHAERGK